jgi:hypothetical protein
MKCHFVSFDHDEKVPVDRYLNNRKLRKYFNRETAAAVLCAAQLLQDRPLPANTPFYYAAGLMTYEEYGLTDMLSQSQDQNGHLSAQRFIDVGINSMSPLTSFKFLPNMALAFISIEQKLTGDNAVVYVAADSLLAYARLAPTAGVVLIGAGQAQQDGSVRAGFAIATRDELAELKTEASQPAISLLQDLAWEHAA